MNSGSADSVLEIAQELGGRGLGDRDVARGLTQAAPFRKRDDQRELAELEPRRQRTLGHRRWT